MRNTLLTALLLLSLPTALPAADDPDAPVGNKRTVPVGDKPEVPGGEKPTAPKKLDTKWHILVNPGRPIRGRRDLPKDGPLSNVRNLELTGPSPGHPFVLGHYADDGKWGYVEGSVTLVEGRNASMKVGHAENFALEGILELGKEGGWFILLGWDQGHGYSLINIGFRESPSPWFITEYRGGAAIADAHQQVTKFSWQKEQPMRITVKDRELTMDVGKVQVLKRQKLANYKAGDIILGVYDTKYGPRPVQIKSLRIRNLEPKPAEEKLEPEAEVEKE